MLTLPCPRLAYTEVLQAEIAAFGIRVLLVEPGATATDFASDTGSGIRVESSEPYQEGIIKYISNMMSADKFASNGANSVAVAERIVEAIDGTGSLAGKEIGLRLPLGKDTGSDLEKRAAVFADLANLKDVWGSV